MNNIYIAFFLTFIAGFSTMIGIIFIFFKISNEFKLICSSLAFASGVMFSISIFDLLPFSFRMLIGYGDIFIFFSSSSFFLIGIYLSFFIDKYVDFIESNSLYKVGIVSMVGMFIHNIPEGIITFISVTKDIRLGIFMCIAIGLHNIPEGIAIGVPIYYATLSKFKTFCYTFVAGFAEFFGAVITYLFLYRYISNFVLGVLFSLTAGIMIQISLFEMLKTSFSYRMKHLTVIFFLIGFFVMIINFMLL